MARSAPPQRSFTELPAAELPAAIAKLRRRLESINAVPAPINVDEIRLRAESVCTIANETYREIFGADSRQAHDAEASTVPFYLSWGSDDWTDHLSAFNEQRRVVAGRLENTISILADRLEHAPLRPTDSASAIQDAGTGPVFLVHGQDGPAKIEVARLLERAGLAVTILHEQPNGGRTIVEKFEDHARTAGFAVVLLTPDDEGGPVGGAMKPRARQNVIGELFWFAAKLSRKRVCALRKGDVEIPSDFAGVVYTDMDDRGAWRQELLRELQNAGYSIDWSRALA